MIISEKQQEANRRNAQHSTGPTTPEGKKAASLNAVTYGLRTRSLLIQGENIADYWRLWDNLEGEWQPETQTERVRSAGPHRPPRRPPGAFVHHRHARIAAAPKGAQGAI